MGGEIKMDFLKLAEQRYSVRQFSPTPVEQEKIDAILEAARLAPTAVNAQPQRILVIQEAEALNKLKGCTGSLYGAPLAFLVCYDRNAAWRRGFDGHGSGEVDASIVGTHMMMEATDLGIGSVWVMAFDPVAIRRAYAIPQDIEPVALFPMGYPAENAAPSPGHEESLPVDAFTVYNAFGV